MKHKTIQAMPVVGLRTEVIKASALAVLTAILVGASTYILSRQMGEGGPREVGTIDAYTDRGGLGSDIVGSFYIYNESISIYACVRDTSNNPVADTQVKFVVRGPPYSNITLTETTKTNSSGFAVVNLPAPNKEFNHPETFLGTWSAVATAEIAGTQITDSIAFEVEPPSSPFIDVYTDRGGNGTATPSQPYSLNQTVNLYAKVSNGTGPIESGLVTFFVYWPYWPDKPFFVTANESNASGIAAPELPLRIPPVQKSVGTWRVIVSVRINDQVYFDSLTFKCTP